MRARPKVYVGTQLKHILSDAKRCKDTLETELAAGSEAPSGVRDDLRELNNKLSRAISSIRGPLNDNWDPAQFRRALKDLEVTKLRAVDQFPEVLDPPYGEVFRGFSCVDDQIVVGQELLALLDQDWS